MSTYLDAAGYLNRAWETARAFYTYPYEIYPEYYETYKWGLYNELIVLELIDALEDEEGYGAGGVAAHRVGEEGQVLRLRRSVSVPIGVRLRPHGVRVDVRFCQVRRDPRHGARQNLWFDVKLKKWYSHPSVRREDSRAFMDRQLASGLVVRGWLNPAYYTLGADPGVSYMAAMGGWGVLDYALNFAPRPYDWLQLGYASYLSSWCLMNTGTARHQLRLLVSRHWRTTARRAGSSSLAKVGSAWMGSSYPGGVTCRAGRGGTTARSIWATAALCGWPRRSSRAIRTSAGSPTAAR